MRQISLRLGRSASLAVRGSPPDVLYGLTDFVDQLDADPPSMSFAAAEAGTAIWDFDAGSVPPAGGQGDIAAGTFPVLTGANQAQIDLLSHAGETGFLHIRMGASNILTSQEISVPSGQLVEVDLGDLSTFTQKIDCTATTDTIAATDQSGDQTPRIRNNTTVTAPGTYTLVFDIDAAAVPTVNVVFYSFDTLPSPAWVGIVVADGSLQYEELVTRVVPKTGGLWTVEIDFGVLSDGAGLIEFGLNESPFKVHRLTDPTSADTVTITNARILQR